jgi:hexosaminidase
MLRKIVFLCFLTCFTTQSLPQSLMPLPARVFPGEQRFQLDGGFYVVADGNTDSRAYRAITRFLRRLDNRTHLFIAKEPLTKKTSGKGLYLEVRYGRVGQLLPGEDESYTLTITGDHALLDAPTDLGVLHGLETFLQLIDYDHTGYFLPGAVIKDEPRFAWRGLLIDVCRHFMPVEVIKRNIDGMAMVKMNTLHLHLSEDQGFRVESKKFPLLHEKGSNGNYYTQEQIRDIIAYASDRGIRVMPEFDMPGHVTSWMVGYPHLASAPGPYEIEKKFGVFDPAMDPTKKSTYRFLKKFIAEMSALFPDPYFHIGGDENNGKQWAANKEIQTFMKKKGIADAHELQAYFNTKVIAIVRKNKKKMVGWDEILQPGLPTDAVIQSWRGKEGLKEAATKGYQVILSNGYYIDLVQPAWKHYINDPLPSDLGLTPEQQKNVLGGEATMWAELITPETIDSRIWPRTAAIAERLWSPANVNSIPDMYRRLKTISVRLEEVGLTHIRYREMMIRRIAGDTNTTPLLHLVELVEPLKDYQRHGQGVAYSTDLPFSRLPDIAAPESETAREFRWLCEAVIHKQDYPSAKALDKMLKQWIANHDALVVAAGKIPALQSWVRMSEQLKLASQVGLECLDFINRRQVVTDEWMKRSDAILKEAEKPIDESKLAVIESIRLLFDYASPK